MEWLGGSFASAKRDPGDIDVAVFLSGEELEQLPTTTKQAVLDLVVGLSPRLTFGTHTFVVAVLPEGHPQFDRYLQTVGFWDRWWSKDRGGTDRGYLEVRGAP